MYRFIRLKFRKNNEDAKDLTQGFFAAALERDFFARLIRREHLSEPISGWLSKGSLQTSIPQRTG